VIYWERMGVKEEQTPGLEKRDSKGKNYQKLTQSAPIEEIAELLQVSSHQKGTKMGGDGKGRQRNGFRHDKTREVPADDIAGNVRRGDGGKKVIGIV